MYKCIFCGLENLSEKARFCNDCGPTRDWLPEDVDLKAKVSQYTSLLSEYFFDSHTAAEIEKLSLRMRERLKISHAKHVEVLSKLSEQKKAIAHLSNFRFEFNENVTDAYAGHDTFLDFRYSNLSQDDAFKVSLLWDDPETTDRVDLRTETKSFVKPLASLTIGCSAVFDRIGIKEISDLQITITDQFGESANFRAEAFRFKVANHEQRITHNISTHNQISIEGRGVVDATGMGADKRDGQQSVNYQPSWKQLSFSYMPRAEAQTLVEDLTAINLATANPKKVSSQVFGLPLALTGSNSISVPTAIKTPTSTHEIQVRIPDIGDFNEVQVTELLVKVGDKVKADQSLITVESDKASLEIPSLHSGILKDLKVKLGDKVREGSLIATIETVDVVEVSQIQFPRENSSNEIDYLEVRIPIGGNKQDLVVTELHVKVGDFVQSEQSVVTVESPEYFLEFPASHSGVVKEIKVRLGEKVNEGALILLLESPTTSKGCPVSDVKCPPLNVYVPSTREYSRLTLEVEFLELMRGVRSRSKNWHILVGGAKSLPKLLVKDLILREQQFVNSRATSGSVLNNPRDLGAILCSLDAGSLLELDGIEEMFSTTNIVGELLYPVLESFQLDVMVGEGLGAREVKLDLEPFCSIFYCKDINKMPITLLNLFDACVNSDD